MSQPENHRTEILEIKKVLAEIGGQVDGIKARVERVLDEQGPEAAEARDQHSGRIVRALREISAANSQEEILSSYLSATRDYLERAVLFLKKGGRYVPWEAYEFDLKTVEPVDGTGVSPVSLAAEDREIVVTTTGLIRSFGWVKASGTIPEMAICVPFLFDDQVPVVLYGDSSQMVHPEDLELLTQVTILILKHHSIRSHLASRSLAEDRVEDQALVDSLPEGESEDPEVAEAQSQEVRQASAVSIGPSADAALQGMERFEGQGETGGETGDEPGHTVREDWIPSGIGVIHHATSLAEDLPAPTDSEPSGSHSRIPDQNKDDND